MYEKVVEVFLTGFIASILGSLIGAGGGFLVVPVLTLMVGIPIHMAIGISLVSVFSTAISAFTTYFRRGFVNLRLGVLLETVTIAGALLGSNVAIALSSSILKLVFGIVLIYVSYRMLKKSVVRESEEFRLELRRLRTLLGYLGSFIAGFMSGLLGIGGGTLKVPIMVLMLNVPVRMAIATSMFMIMITSATALSTYVINNLVDFTLAFSIAVGAIIGAQVGSRLSFKFKSVTLKSIFALLLLAFSLMMVVSGIQEYPIH